jgi:hypothetical protein
MLRVVEVREAAEPGENPILVVVDGLVWTVVRGVVSSGLAEGGAACVVSCF